MSRQKHVGQTSEWDDVPANIIKAYRRKAARLNESAHESGVSQHEKIDWQSLLRVAMRKTECAICLAPISYRALYTMPTVPFEKLRRNSLKDIMFVCRSCGSMGHDTTVPIAIRIEKHHHRPNESWCLDCNRWQREELFWFPDGKNRWLCNNCKNRRRRAPRRIGKCKNCGKLIEVRGQKHIACSSRCYTTIYYKHRRSRAANPLPERVCANPACDTIFVPFRKGKVYCKRACNKAHQYQRNKKKRKRKRA